MTSDESKNLNKEDALQILHKIRGSFTEAMDLVEKDSEDYWNSLSKEDQLRAFCAVSRRIYQGEIVDRGSYRHVLYSVFGFGTEAYAPAQMARYLEIHNSIYTSEHDSKLLKTFCEKYGIEDSDKKIQDFGVR